MASVRERTSKGGERTWQVLYRDGKRQKSKTFETEKAAGKFVSLLDVLGPERALAELAGPARPKGVTVDELAAQFFAWKVRDVTPRTMGDYRRDYTNWVRPAFGEREAASIDEGDVQRWVDKIARELSPKSVGDRHMLLHAMFKFGKAKTRRLVTHNPCEETELPRVTRKPPKGMMLPEWHAILGAAEKRNPDARDLILFLGSMGWRWSEAAALAVRDVMDDGEDVWAGVTRVFRIVENRQVLEEGAAKSWAGFRRSRVPPEAAEMFRRRIAGKGPEDFVFTNSGGRHWNQNTFLRDTWPALLKDAGVGTQDRKPTPHWLRHMSVASMADANIPMHQIQRVIGHENIDTTNSTYGGTVGSLSSEAVRALGEVLSGKPRQSQVVRGEVVTLLGELGP